MGLAGEVTAHELQMNPADYSGESRKSGAASDKQCQVKMTVTDTGGEASVAVEISSAEKVIQSQLDRCSRLGP